jgi:hypothetical protein
MLTHILKCDPAASPEKAERLAKVWDEVVSSIIKEMLARAKPHMDDLHIDLREEMALELAKLISFISTKVVADRMNGRIVKDIDPQVEREQCFSSKGREKISMTAQNLAEGVWLRRYAERWKPKTEAALSKEKKQKRAYSIPKRVRNTHFISESFIKRYWSEGQSVYRSVKTPEGLDEKKKTPVGGWGFRPNLYSDCLEKYFGLIEGDAVTPIQMVLNVEPLNRPRREAIVGFIVIQRIRNPYFKESLERSIAPVVTSHVGADNTEDRQYMRAVYETLYSENDFYDRLARPIIYSPWVVVSSECPDFVLPDVCNLFGSYDGRQYVVMPLTPKDCLIVLPREINEPRIVPYYVKASASMVADVSYVLRCAAKKEFLSHSTASFVAVNEEPNKVMQRIICALATITADE